LPRYILYNDDVEAARFAAENSVITDFAPTRPELLPMQLLRATAEGFTVWLRERAIDLNNPKHRSMMQLWVGSRDKTVLALRTHMFSISDTFTCFEEGEFIPRAELCKPEEQNAASEFILISSDTSLRRLEGATPNASTDGSFTKTWRFEGNAWWLYKLQPSAATRAEVEISRVLRALGWSAAEYAYVGSYRRRVRSRSFLRPHEFFEAYDSFRFRFENPGDDDDAIQANLAAAEGKLNAAKGEMEARESAEKAAKAERTCPQCGHENPEGTKFCQECGSKLGAQGNVCPSCGTANPSGVKFCQECGTKLQSEPTGVCPSCGQENPPGTRFCGGCGERLEG